jgi:predicted small secreted protein
MKRQLIVPAAILAGAVLVSTWGCSKATWKQIGEDTREGLETTGQAIEGAAKGAIEAIEKD